MQSGQPERVTGYRFRLPPSCIADFVFLRYLSASAMALAADFGVFLLALRFAVPAVAGAVVSYSLGILVHWLISSRAVFSETVAAAGPERARQKTLFVATALLGLALTAAITGTAAMMAIDPFAAKLIAATASFGMTWTLRRRFVFA